MSRNKKKRASVKSSVVQAKGKSVSVQTAAEQAAVAASKPVQEQESAVRKPEIDTPKQKEPVMRKNSEAAQPDKAFFQNVKEHLLSANPVLVKAVAVVPILGAATSLKNGILLSGVMLFTVVFLNLVMYPLYRIIPRGYRFAVCLLAAGAAITPAYFLAKEFAPTSAGQCAVYLPLLAACALPMIEKSHYGKKFGIFKTVLNAVLDGVGFAFAAIIFSIIREIIGNGTLYDRALPYVSQAKFSFALMPAGALLLMGLLTALFRKIYGIHDDAHTDDAHFDDSHFYDGGN